MKNIIRYKSVLFIGVVMILSACTSVNTDIVIPVEKEKVWNVLTDTEKIKEWNSVLVPLNGALSEGTKINYEFNDGKSKSEIPAIVDKIVEKELINQSGGMWGILTFNHKYMLDEVESGTKVTIHEEYKGIMVPFWNSDPVEKAYEKLLLELKQRVISLTKIQNVE